MADFGDGLMHPRLTAVAQFEAEDRLNSARFTKGQYVDMVLNDDKHNYTPEFLAWVERQVVAA